MSKEFTFFSLAIKNLKRKSLRTAILIIAIGLLVSVFVFILSFVRRVDSSIRVTSERLGADILIVPTGSRGAAEDVLLENRAKTFYMDKGLIERVKGIKGIDQLTYQTYLVSLIGICCDVPESVVIAFNQNTDFVIKPWLTKKLGRRLQNGEAIVGSESAFNIRIGLMEVDSVLFGNVFKMVGVLDKTGTGLDNAIFIDDANIEEILKNGKSDLKPEQISIIFTRVKKGYDSRKVANDIEDSIIEVDTVIRRDIGKNLISALSDFNKIFFVTVVLASILSIFLVWAIFSAIANERAREVGIMRAIGAGESHVVRLFFLEVLIIGIIGSVFGIISGTVLSIFLSKSFAILKSLSSGLSIIDRIMVAILSLIAGTGICIGGALSPIQRIKKLEPLLAIKEE
jgi:putative ABC transport system permease protein